jgi:hypothetical protein
MNWSGKRAAVRVVAGVGGAEVVEHVAGVGRRDRDVAVHEQEVEVAVAVEIGELGVGAAVEEEGELRGADVGEPADAVVEDEQIGHAAAAGGARDREVEIAVVVAVPERDRGGGAEVHVEGGALEGRVLGVGAGGAALQAALVAQQREDLRTGGGVVLRAVAGDQVEVAIAVHVAGREVADAGEGDREEHDAGCGAEGAGAVVMKDCGGQRHAVVEARPRCEIVVAVGVEVGGEHAVALGVVGGGDARRGFVHETGAGVAIEAQAGHAGGDEIGAAVAIEVRGGGDAALLEVARGKRAAGVGESGARGGVGSQRARRGGEDAAGGGAQSALGDHGRAGEGGEIGEQRGGGEEAVGADGAREGGVGGTGVDEQHAARRGEQAQRGGAEQDARRRADFGAAEPELDGAEGVQRAGVEVGLAGGSVLRRQGGAGREEEGGEHGHL